MMKVTILECDETVHVTFWENHCGHEQEIGRIGLDEQTRSQISGIYTNNYNIYHYVLIILIYNIFFRKIERRCYI